VIENINVNTNGVILDHISRNMNDCIMCKILIIVESYFPFTDTVILNSVGPLCRMAGSFLDIEWNEIT